MNRILPGSLALAMTMSAGSARAGESPKPRAHVVVRGIYGGVPRDPRLGPLPPGVRGQRGLDGLGQLDAGADGPPAGQGVRVFAEFNTLHDASYLKDHPDAAPIGPDGQRVAAPGRLARDLPDPPGLPEDRMEAFRRLLQDYDVDGIWLDYHHCPRQLGAGGAEPAGHLLLHPLPAPLQERHGHDLPDDTADTPPPPSSRPTGRPGSTGGAPSSPTGSASSARSSTRRGPRRSSAPSTARGPTTTTSGARIDKLAIDLKAQAAYVDVFSPMPYHARFGHPPTPSGSPARPPGWDSHLGDRGTPGEKHQIWPIVQLSDWGEAVPSTRCQLVLDHGSRRPATGVMVFAWGSLRKQPEKVEAVGRLYRAIR